MSKQIADLVTVFTADVESFRRGLAAAESALNNPTLSHISQEATMTAIVLAIPPSANKYWRSVNGRVLRSREANEYKQVVGWQCNMAQMTPIEGDVRLTLRVYRGRKQGDLDNRIKVVADALQGFAYHDDNQIVELHAYRYDDKLCPRVEVEIEAI